MHRTKPVAHPMISNEGYNLVFPPGASATLRRRDPVCSLPSQGAPGGAGIRSSTGFPLGDAMPRLPCRPWAAGGARSLRGGGAGAAGGGAGKEASTTGLSWENADSGAGAAETPQSFPGAGGQRYRCVAECHPDGQRRDRHRTEARAEPPAAPGRPGGPSVPSPGPAAGGARALPRAIAAGPGNRTPRRDTHGGLGRGG